MKTIEFTIPGIPVAKARPQVRTVHTGEMYYNKHRDREEEKIHAFLHTPEKSVNFENLVRMAFVATCGDAPTQEPVEIEIRAFFQIAKSAKKSDREDAAREVLPHTKKPDSDNVVKAVLDGLNTVAFADDKQVFRITVSKWYSNRPRTEVTITIQSQEEAAWQKRKRSYGHTNGHSMSSLGRKTESDQTCLDLSSISAVS